MKAKFIFILIFSINSHFSVFAQKKTEILGKLIEKLIELPKEKNNLATSCIILLKVNKEKDSLQLLNKIDKEYEFIIAQLNNKKNKEQIFKKAIVNSIITISILSVSENDTIDNNSINIISPNLLSTLEVYRKFKNNFFYEPICIINQFDTKRKI